jgi:hypothetical protein
MSLAAGTKLGPGITARQLNDSTIYRGCTPGTVCDLSSNIITFICPNLGTCNSSFDGQTYNDVAGHLTISADVFIPLAGLNGMVTVPAIVSGQLFLENCLMLSDCLSPGPTAVGLNIIGAGTLTARFVNPCPGCELVFDPKASWAGLALLTPEPPGWSLVLGAFVVVVISKRRELRSLFSDTAV